MAFRYRWVVTSDACPRNTGSRAQARLVPDLKTRFGAVASELSASEAAINEELLTAQGSPVDIGGYYRPDATLTEQVMRPSETLNTIIDRL